MTNDCRFSAKGAVFMTAWGSVPEKPHVCLSALKARFTRALSRAFGACPLWNPRSWGSAPGWYESTLSTLKEYTPLGRGYR
jgi:hypothetical protein